MLVVAVDLIDEISDPAGVLGSPKEPLLDGGWQPVCRSPGGDKGPLQGIQLSTGVVSSVHRGQGGQFCLCPKGHREVELQVPLAGMEPVLSQLGPPPPGSPLYPAAPWNCDSLQKPGLWSLQAHLLALASYPQGKGALVGPAGHLVGWCP